MSIEDELLEPASITEGNRALALFTDRYELTRLFVDRLNDDPAPQTILFFYGEGGNGKSLLLKYLRQNACKRLSAEGWQQIKAKPDAELAYVVSQLKPGTYRPVPTAFLDFESKPLGDVQPQDRFFGLLTLRNELAESAAGNATLKFRRFDFACVWYLFKKGQSPEKIKSFFPADQGLGLATSVIDTLTDASFGGLAKGLLDLVSPNWSQRLQVWRTRFGISKEEIEGIVGKDLDKDLMDALPGYLAEDLNEAMIQPNAPPRIVLFFDTHEAFARENPTGRQNSDFFRDLWLRRLLRKLDYDRGIVAVVAGRDQPRWGEAKTTVEERNTDIPEQYVQLQRVGNLSEQDALAYLQQPDVGISNESLCHSLITYASVESGEVHPLHLGLCADVVLQAQVQGTPLSAEEFDSVPDFADKSKLLIERLLKYVSDTVRDAIYALSACRAFDFELYNRLGETLKFASNRSDFDLITRFSFVKQLPEPRQQWHRLHGLLRRLNAEDVNERVMATHHFLEQHYRNNEQPAEAIYHANQLNSIEGTQEWIHFFEESLALDQYQDCEALLEVHRELTVVSDFQLGLISKAKGDYYRNLAQHEEAKQEYLLSIDIYQDLLSHEPRDFAALNNKGLATQCLGNMYVSISQYDDALCCYQQAAVAFDRILSQSSDAIGVLINQGNTLRRMGELKARLLQCSNAVNSYDKSIKSYNDVLRLSPQDIDALNGKANSLQGAGLVQSLLATSTEDLTRVMKSYKKSIETYDKALEISPDDTILLNGKGSVFAKLGQLQERLLQFNEALKSYKQAAATFDDIFPDSPTSLHNKGLALANLGRLQAALAQCSDASNSLNQAIAAYDYALSYAPNYVEVLNSKGLTYKCLSELQDNFKLETEAFLSLHLALSCLNRSLIIAPKDVFIRKLRDQIQAFLDSAGDAE